MKIARYTSKSEVQLVLLSVSCLVTELFCSHNHDRYANSLFILIDKPGRGYHYSDRNACGESAASKKTQSRMLRNLFLSQIFGIFDSPLIFVT